MKHRNKGRKLSRVKKQRKSLLKTLVGSLIIHEKITTTEAKAKEVKPIADKIINVAKKAKIGETGKMTAVRNLGSRLPRKAADKLLGDFIGRFDSRSGGYTRIIKLDRRKSDSAKMAVIEFV